MLQSVVQAQQTKKSSQVFQESQPVTLQKARRRRVLSGPKETSKDAKNNSVISTPSVSKVSSPRVGKAYLNTLPTVGVSQAN